MIQQLRKLLKNAVETGSMQGKIPHEQQVLFDAVLMGISSAPSAVPDEALLQPAPSKRRRLQFLEVPKTTGLRKMKMLEQKRKNIRLGHPTKSDWMTIVRKHGKCKKVKEEERLKILDWVRAHPNVVNSPIARDTIICPDPIPEEL